MTSQATMSDMPSCHEVIQLVTDYLEGAMSPDEQERFRAHLDNCDGCGAYVEQIRTTVRVMGHATPEALSPGARQELLAVYRKWKAESAGRHSGLRGKLRKLFGR